MKNLTLFLQRMLYTYQFISFENILLCAIFHDFIPMNINLSAFYLFVIFLLKLRHSDSINTL